jgi:pimeloyl-ACP methyl ester carboxylesterase
VIGWSFGGAVSMKLAEIAPELATKIILTCSTSHLGAIMFDDNHVQIKTYEQIRQHPRILQMEQLRQSGNR